ncbi:hypothetical protein SPF06_05480 [Sinomonas sp. JGH33]|uniref:Uncharacterized protein n=1 Tax=Sinomonas terricola TaxID=3110330 RepID=A0ABU5T3C9_9MICC|nr:hypothetical protein [Sinomonas sp. JGH33]MEA5454171.1 hypothetical protein [Sinomonas sp. JGH33]
MSSRNVIARHRAALVRSSLIAAVQAASGNAGIVSRQAGGHASVLSDAVRAHRMDTSQKAKSTHTESSAFYTLR